MHLLLLLLMVIQIANERKLLEKNVNLINENLRKTNALILVTAAIFSIYLLIY